MGKAPKSTFWQDGTCPYIYHSPSLDPIQSTADLCNLLQLISNKSSDVASYVFVEISIIEMDLSGTSLYHLQTPITHKCF